MVGIGVVTSFEAGPAGKFCLWLLAETLSKGDLLRTSGFTSASFGFQFASKLTIGRPGLSLTTVGVGSLGLRSFKRMLVACRISSLLISSPSFVGTVGEACAVLGPASVAWGTGRGLAV